MVAVHHHRLPVSANRRDAVLLAEESLCISFSSSCDLLFASQISNWFLHTVSHFVPESAILQVHASWKKIYTHIYKASHSFHLLIKMPSFSFI